MVAVKRSMIEVTIQLVVVTDRSIVLLYYIAYILYCRVELAWWYYKPTNDFSRDTIHEYPLQFMNKNDI